MKKLIPVTILVVLISGLSAKTAFAERYRINEAAVDVLFNSASSLSADALSLSPAMGTLSTAATSEKSALAAIVIDFFLGGFGIHRVYLGGKGVLVVGYILTCGGIFGLVPLIDMIVLAINYDDISKYVGNDKFFMW